MACSKATVQLLIPLYEEKYDNAVERRVSSIRHKHAIITSLMYPHKLICQQRYQLPQNIQHL
jgi:hypothetical protein